MAQLSARVSAALMISALATKGRAAADEILDDLVTVPERRVMFRLMAAHDGGPVPTTSLLGAPGTGAITTSPALSRVVQKLEDQGYVTRTLSKQDRRHRLIEVTPAGRELWQEILSAFESAADKTYGNLSEADLTTLTQILSNLGDGLPDWPNSQ